MDMQAFSKLYRLATGSKQTGKQVVQVSCRQKKIETHKLSPPSCKIKKIKKKSIKYWGYDKIQMYSSNKYSYTKPILSLESFCGDDLKIGTIGRLKFS